MYTIIQQITFCYAHRLLGYNGKCKNLHGHNARVEIEITGKALNEFGMVADFSELKNTIQRWIDDTLDHTCFLKKNDPLVPYLIALNEHFLLFDENPTTEVIAQFIYNSIQHYGFAIASVRVWETDINAAIATCQ